MHNLRGTQAAPGHCLLSTSPEEGRPQFPDATILRALYLTTPLDEVQHFQEKVLQPLGQVFTLEWDADNKAV